MTGHAQIDVKLNLAMQGKFSFFVTDKNGKEIEGKRGEFQQVVTDYFWKTANSGAYQWVYWGGSSAPEFAKYLKVGTGGVERTVSDVGLTAPVAATSIYYHDVANSLGEFVTIESRNFFKKKIRFYFAYGAINATLSEIGLFKDNNNISMSMGQLIKDGFGNPTTVTVTNTEQLYVDYEYYMERLEGDIDLGSGVLSLDGTDYNYSIIGKLLTWRTIGGGNAAVPHPEHAIYILTPSNTGWYLRAMYNTTLIGGQTISQKNHIVLQNKSSLTKVMTFPAATDIKTFNKLQLYQGNNNLVAMEIIFDATITKPKTSTFTAEVDLTVQWRAD